MPRRRLFLLLLAAALLGGWYLFRPERAFLDRRVSEAPPPTGATAVRRGEFQALAHEGSGHAEIWRTPDGGLILRLSAFRTSDGPDLRVYLVGRPGLDGTGGLRAAGYLDLGGLRGNTGDQTYAIPAGTDLDRLPVVSIWCRRFGVNFTEATTVAPQ